MSMGWKKVQSPNTSEKLFFCKHVLPSLFSHMCTELSVGFGFCVFLVNLQTMRILISSVTVQTDAPHCPNSFPRPCWSEQLGKFSRVVIWFLHKVIIEWPFSPGEFSLSFRSRYWPDGTGLSAWICKAGSGGSVWAILPHGLAKWPAQNLCHSNESLLLCEERQHNAKYIGPPLNKGWPKSFVTSFLVSS